MDEKNAWSNFVSSGSIKDYIIYSQVKQDDFNRSQGAASYADQYGWADNNGEEYRGERPTGNYSD